MKKTFRLTIAAFGLAMVIFNPFVVQVQADDYTYTTNNGTITITGYSGSNSVVIIPDTINNLPVTSIGAFAFDGLTNLTSVTLPDGVTDIEGETFGGLGFTGAFAGCCGLTNVTMGNSVTNIGNWAFANCTSLASVTIPNCVKSIGGGAFLDCTSLTSVTIPNGVTELRGARFDMLAYGPFYGCTSLTNITIPATVTSIFDSTFYYCTSLTAITVAPLNSSYSSADGVLFDKSQTTLIQCPQAKAGIYVIPNSATTIWRYAFSAASLSSVRIPNSVTEIGDWAFASCSSLTNVTIGNGVTDIGYGAFQDCSSLTSVTIPDSVMTIGSSAFSSCTALASVAIGASLTSIEDNTFYGCSSLTSVTIPKSVTGIWYGAFDRCINLRSAYFQGNAPVSDGEVFGYANNATAIVYYLPGTTGWNTDFGGLPTALWVLPYPVMLTSTPSFGVQTNGFGFTISWATNASVVVEASTTLANPLWSPISTNSLTSGTANFTDPDWQQYPGRFYRIRSL